MTFDKTSVYEKNLSLIHGWIKSVDQKLSTFVAIQGVLAVFLSPLILKELSSKFLLVNSWLVGVLALAYWLLCYGLLKCLWSLRSRLRVKNQLITEDQLSLTYFNHIQKMSLDSYKKKMQELKSKTYDEELLSQIHVSAGIATKKHIHFNDAIILFILGGTMSVFILGWLYLI